MKKGNITIEAALILPLIILILLLLLITSMVLHDLILMRSYNGLRADYEVVTSEDSVESYGSYLLLKPKDWQSKTDHFGYAIYQTKAYDLYETLIGKLDFNIQDRRQYKVMAPKVYVRTLDMVDDLTDQIGFTRKIKDDISNGLEKFEELMNK